MSGFHHHREMTMETQHAGLTARLARYAATHSRTILAIWGIAIVLALGLAATALHGLTSTGYATGPTQSARASAAIDRAFPAKARAAATDVVVVSSEQLRASDPRFRAFVATLERRLGEIPGTTGITSYLS